MCAAFGSGLIGPGGQKLLDKAAQGEGGIERHLFIRQNEEAMISLIHPVRGFVVEQADETKPRSQETRSG